MAPMWLMTTFGIFTFGRQSCVFYEIEEFNQWNEIIKVMLEIYKFKQLQIRED